MSLKLLTVAMLAACVALTGCDDQQSDRAVQKLKEFFNAVKPDALLLKNMTPGITTEAQIRDQMDNFGKIRIGMTEDEVRRLLGKPGQIAVFPLKPETVWSWKWREGGVTEEGIFNVHFDQYQKVYTTSRSDVIRGR